MKHYKIILSIAGSDSSGGAGIQADIKTISAHGLYAATAITAITVQNTLGVSAIHAVPIEILEGQIEAVLSDIGADAIKIGMLHSAEVVELVARMIDKYKVRNVVLDPVMVSTSGHRLIEQSAIESLKRELMPLSRIITPNIPEAEILLGRKITEQQQLPELAEELAAQTGASVLLKAGHLVDDELIDIIYDAELQRSTPLTSQRLITPNTHGTGCTLSSAVASALALGMNVTEAAASAKEYISGAIASGAHYSIGGGHGPVDHLFDWRK